MKPYSPPKRSPSSPHRPVKDRKPNSNTVLKRLDRDQKKKAKSK